MGVAVPASLHGHRILVTRDAQKARTTAAAIERRGGVPVVFPTIAFASPEDPEPLRRALGSLGTFSRVVVSSPTGAGFLVREAGSGGLEAAARFGTRFAAVGRTTAAVLRQAGVGEVLVPVREDAEGLLGVLLADGASGGRTLVLRAEQGRDVVVEGLRSAGAEVDSVVAYRTVTATVAPSEVEALRSSPPPDAALFLSPSAFDGLFVILGEDGAREVLRGTLVVAIGPTTARAMESRGVWPGLVSPRPDLESVLDAVAGVLESRSR